MSIAPNAAPKPSSAAAIAAAPQTSTLYREQAIPESPQSSLSFWDLLDVINPLQHIPVVGTIYRALTGDEISTPARVAGGTLYGGVVGFAASVAGAIVEEETGRDPGAHVVAMLFGDEAPDAAPDTGPVPETAVAEAPVPEPAAGSAPAPQPAAGIQPTPESARTVAMAVPEREGAPTGRFYALPPRELALPVIPAEKAEASAEPPDEVPAPAPAPEPAAGAPSGEWPPGGPAPLPPALVADAMMSALDKYESAARLARKP